MKEIKIQDLEQGMEIIVNTTPLGPKAILAKHTVSHTSAGHPGKKTVYCKNGFSYTEDHLIYLNDAVNKTFLILESNTEVIDYDE